MEKTLKPVCCCDTHEDERASLILICCVLDGKENEKAPLETHTFGWVTNSSGVKSLSASQQRCVAALGVCLFCFQWNPCRFPCLQYVALFSTPISVLGLASRGKLVKVCTDGSWHTNELWTLA